MRRTRWRTRNLGHAVLALASCLMVLPAMAQDPTAGAPAPSPPSPQGSAPGAPSSNDELRKAAQNPISKLVSVPIQDSSSFDTGDYDRTQSIVKVQPVIPVPLGKNWNLIMRIIQPITYQPDDNAPTGSTAGLGDMNPSFFISPEYSGKVTWAVGPVLLIPTATNSALGDGKFCIGPTAAVLTQPGPWTIGVLVNNYWSVAGASDRKNVNQMLLQYFLDYNLRHGWYLVSSPEMTAKWLEPSDKVWTVPLGGGIGRIVHFGSQATKISAQLFRNAVYPLNGSTWSMRVQVALLYPKKPPGD